MQNKLFILFVLLTTAGLLAPGGYAQEQVSVTEIAVDTIFEPNVVFNGMPKVYEIADIKFV